MRSFLFLILCAVPFALFADARFVEAPAECHFPWDNNNVDNEYKLQSCRGVLYQGGGGTFVSVVVYAERENIPVGFTLIDGKDISDTEAYPGGSFAIQTTGADSGTNCNVVDAGGTTYTTNNWTATTKVFRRKDIYRADVTFDLTCWAAVAQ